MKSIGITQLKKIRKYFPNPGDDAEKLADLYVKATVNGASRHFHQDALSKRGIGSAVKDIAKKLTETSD